MARRFHRLFEAALLAAATATGCERTPELAGEHLGRGDKALADGRPGDALVAYTHAHELAPQEPRVQQAVMRARVYVMAETPARVGAEALDDVRYEALFLLDHDKPHEAVYLTALGNVLARKGDVDGARARLGEALKADPQSALAHAALGALLLGRGDARAEARAELEQALRLKGDAREALLALGQLQLAEGDVAGAVPRLEAALRGGDDVAVRLALGAARQQQKKPAEAAEQFQRAAQLDPKSADALSALGQALLAAGQLDGAEQALRAALQLRHDDGTSLALGFTLAREKKSEQALGVFAQLLGQDGGMPSALYGAAAASEDMGRVEQALELYKRLLAIPADGRQKAMVGELHQEAQARVTALAAKAAAAASSRPDAGAPPARR